jgi:imidazolonepropionase-like amidohydrolase
MKLLFSATVAVLLAWFAGVTSSLDAQQPPGVRAYTGMRLIDGTDRAPIDNATIVVRDGRIVAAGQSSSVNVPAGAERIALTGKTVTPGFINAHGHVNNTARDLSVYAAYGVTTVYSLGDEKPDAFAARDAQNAPTLNRSRVFVAGPVLAPKSPDDARELVGKNKALKTNVIKIRVDDNLGTTAKMTPEIYRAVIDESHKQGLRTEVHLFYLADAKGVLDAGADLIAHSVRDQDVDAALIAQMKSRNVCLVPTLMREVSTFVYDSTPAFFSDPLFLAHADEKWVSDLKDPAAQAKVKVSTSAQKYKAALEVANRNLKKLSDSGVPIAMGTDTGPAGRFQGYFELMEIEMMVKAGLTPKQALLAATRDAARCQKIDADLGTIEGGKWADFVVLNGDPLANITNVRQIDAVYIAGNKIAR